MIALAVGALGALLLVVSAVGLFRLRDPLARQHAATKSATLALGLLLLAVAIEANDTGWWARVALVLVFLVATLPMASNVLARAAVRESVPEEDVRDAPRADR